MAAGRRAVWDTACEKVGIEPTAHHTSVQALIFMTEDADKIAGIKSGDMGERSIAGSNEQIIDELGQLGALGFDEVIVPDFTLGGSAEQRRDAYERFAAEIAPAVN